MTIEQYKIVFTGPMGAGKTTAIASVSLTKPVSTEGLNTDRAANAKSTTTVSMDYGEVTIGDGAVLRLYGTPGQIRFRLIWDMLAKGALGLIVLVDNSRPAPLEDMLMCLEPFPALVHSGAVVIRTASGTPMAPFESRRVIALRPLRSASHPKTGRST